MSDIIKEMKQLICELNNASKAYYGGNSEIMPNAIWDAKLNELEALELKYGIVLPCSPTHNVSHEVIVGEKESHEFPALSLPKSKNVDDILKWTQGKAVDLSWKLDGMTLVVTWDNGKLTKVVTRGDGEIGSNITHLVDAIGNIPKTISYEGHLVVRGEAVISYDDFDNINIECNNAYENPRNLVAGSLNPLTQVDVIMNRHINWIPFTLVHLDETIVSWKDRMLFLQSLGFDVVDFEFIGDTNCLKNVISNWSNNVENSIYPVDGLVVVYDDTNYASGGTLTGHHDTRGGFAFKWADEESETELVDIEWSVSIHSINPVAIFKPVRLEGTTVQRASLCNISECERLGIGGIGTKLTVIKANKIIPKVIKAVGVGEFVIPKTCPICKHNTYVNISSSGAKILVCENQDCAAKTISMMTRFVSKHGFNITGLSDKKLMDLVNKNLISNVIDIFELLSNSDAVRSVLCDSDGWGDKSIENLLESVSSAKSVKSENLLYALCIPMCGRDIAKKLTKKYTLSDIISKAIFDANNDTTTVIDGIDGIGDVKGQSFINWFKSSSNVDLINKLVSICNVIDTNVKENTNDSKLTNLTFVITGKLNHYSSRDVLKSLIEDNGGKVSGSVSANTDYLINNDIESNSSKNKKAKELGVTIISEDDFIDKFCL